MCFSSETTKAPGAMIVVPPSPGRASVFSMCFLEEVFDYDLPMDLRDDTDGVTLPGTYMDKMDMIGIGHILDAALRKPNYAFDMFGVSAIDFKDVTLYDACAYAMNMIDTGRILDASPPGPRSFFYMFGISMLEIDDDDDGLVAADIIHNTVSVKEASDSMDPPLSFDTMSGFVTRFNDISDGNNDMSIFLCHNIFLRLHHQHPQHIYMMLMMWETQMTHWVAGQSVILIQRTGKLHPLLVDHS